MNNTFDKSKYSATNRMAQVSRITCLLILLLPTVGFAQGQGSYGGYLADAVTFVRFAGLVLVILFLIAIRKIFGTRVMAVVGVVLFMVEGSLVIQSRYKEEALSNASKAITINMHNECLKHGVEQISAYASGREKVFVSIHGDHLVREHQSDLLLNATKLTPEFTFVETTPTTAEADANALLVNVTYDRSEVPGSLPDYAWYRTKITTEIKNVSSGAILATRNDVQLRQGFCLGDHPLHGMVGFVRKVLGNPNFYRADKNSKESPFRYIPVVANIGETQNGAFQKITTEEFNKRSEAMKDRWSEARRWVEAIPSCQVKEVVLSSPVATCGAGELFENQFSLDNMVGLVQLPRDKSWLAVFRKWRAISSLDALQVEQRDFAGRPVNAWFINFPIPTLVDIRPPHHMGDFASVQSVMVKEDKLFVLMNWQYKWWFDKGGNGFNGHYFERQALVSAALPGL